MIEIKPADMGEVDQLMGRTAYLEMLQGSDH
jgi:hypothetical protein